MAKAKKDYSKKISNIKLRVRKFRYFYVTLVKILLLFYQFKSLNQMKLKLKILYYNHFFSNITKRYNIKSW